MKDATNERMIAPLMTVPDERTGAAVHVGSVAWLERVVRHAHAIPVQNGNDVHPLSEIPAFAQLAWLREQLGRPDVPATTHPDEQPFGGDCLSFTTTDDRGLYLAAAGSPTDDDMRGLRESWVPARAKVTITRMAQTVLRPIRFAVAEYSRPHFQIHRLQVGTVPLLSNPGPIHAQAFPEIPTEGRPFANVPPIAMAPGLQVTLTVENLCQHFPIRFDAFLYCDAPMRRREQEDAGRARRLMFGPMSEASR